VHNVSEWPNLYDICRLPHKMPFGRETRVVPSTNVLDRGPGPLRKEKIWRSEPSVRSDAAYRQITSHLVYILRLRIILHSIDLLHALDQVNTLCPEKKEPIVL